MDISERKIKRVEKFSDAIIYIKKISNSALIIVDSSSNVRYIDLSNFKVLDSFKIDVKFTWYKNSVISFSNCGNYFASVAQETKNSKLYNSKTKKMIAKVERHYGGVSCVGIDRKDKYFFSCGEDGKIFVVDIKNGGLAFTLPHHIDTINDIAFSQNNQLVATAGYDKQILIFNFAVMSPVAKLRAHTSAIMKIHFLSNNRLFSYDEDGAGIIWDLGTQKVITRLSGIHDSVTQVSANDNFLFLGTKLGFIIVYNLENYEIVERKFVKFKSAITSMIYDDYNDSLIVGCENGELCGFGIYEGRRYLDDLLEDKNYDSMYKYVESNQILKYTSAYIRLNEIWDETLVKATELLQSAQKTKATELFFPFSHIPSKNSIIKNLFEEYSEFETFILHIKNGNIALAYSLARKHPSYQNSKIYLAIEERWRKLFGKAHDLALEIGGKEKVNKLLHQYRGVSEKSKSIQEMVLKSEKYTRFKNAIAKKEFKIAFELVKINPFLEEFDEYFSLLTYGDSLHIKISKAVKEGNFNDAIKLLRILVDFPDFEDEAKSMIKDIENQALFLKAYQQNDYRTSYNILSKSSILIDTFEGKKLSEKWENDYSLAESYASKGDVYSIDTAFKDYKNIPSKNMAIVSIYALAYINQIESFIAKKTIDKEAIEKAFKNYIINFGYDDHIQSTFDIYEKEYGKSKLELELLKKGSRATWRVSMRVKSILDD